MHRTKLFLVALLIAVAHAQNPFSKEVESAYPDAHALYLDLHEHPELSGHETETAAKLAARLRSAGYDVTEHVGGTGVMAILKNGSGPAIILRTELDALPVEEKTGLPYASRVHTKDDAGRDVPVMHACGHRRGSCGAEESTEFFGGGTAAPAPPNIKIAPESAAHALRMGRRKEP